MKIILIDTKSKFIISTHSDAHVTLNKLRPWGMRRFGFLMDSPWVLPCWPCYLEQKPSIKQPNELPRCGEQSSEHGAAILRKLHAGAAAYCPRAVTREGSPAAACSCLLLPCAEMDRSPGLQSCQEPGLEVRILGPPAVPSKTEQDGRQLGGTPLCIYSELHAGKSVQEDDRGNCTMMALG